MTKRKKPTPTTKREFYCPQCGYGDDPIMYEQDDDGIICPKCECRSIQEIQVPIEPLPDGPRYRGPGTRVPKRKQ